jgi:hypothetical protein
MPSPFPGTDPHLGGERRPESRGQARRPHCAGPSLSHEPTAQGPARINAARRAAGLRQEATPA